MHRLHPNPELGDPDSALVWDDCAKCDAMAVDPRLLDSNRLTYAYARAKGDDWSGTKNEYKLFSVLYLIWVTNQRLTEAGVPLL